jgi:hypothetical protein
VSAVAAQVVRFSVQVQIPHIILLITMALEKLKSLSEQDLLEFADDSIKYLSGASVPFLSKYRERFGDSLLIVPCRTLIIDLFQVALRGTTRNSNLENFKTALAEYGEVPDALSAIIYGRRQETAKYLTQAVFRQATDSILLDYNFNVETVVSSDSYLKVHEQILNLELVL